MRRITSAPAMRGAVGRLTGTRTVAAGPSSLAGQITGLADALVGVLDQATRRGLLVPPVISNSVHDLRGWAARVDQATTFTRPAAVDATRLLGYLRGLPDQQLLALLADLPWARLDTLLDAVSLHQPPSPFGSPRP
jgi:hypothetical protein